MEIRPAEISEILKKQIAAFDTEANVAETGQVLSVGDGIARVFGLQNCMAGEMVEFPGAGLRGMALNLETDNVGVVIFGDDKQIREGDTVQPHRLASSTCRWATGCSAAWSMRSAIRSTARARSSAPSGGRVEVKAPGIIPRKSVHEPMQTGSRRSTR